MRKSKLSDIAKVNPTLPSELRNQLNLPVSFVPMAAVSETGQLEAIEERTLGDVLNGYSYFERGDVLLAKITPCMENGKAVFLDGNLPHRVGYGSTEFHVIRPGKELDGKYLFYLLWNPVFRHIAERNMTGSAGQKRVPTGFLKSYEIPLPPLAEQKRIAAILDQADAIRRKRAQALNLVDTFLKSAFLSMFGDPVTNPKNWPVQTITEVGAEVQIGPFGSLLHKSDYVTAGIPLINPKHISNGNIQAGDTESVSPEKADDLTNYWLQPGDVIMGRRGEMGRCAVIDDDHGKMLCGTGSLFIRPNRRSLTPLYLLKLLSSGSMKQHLENIAQGVTMANLNATMIKNLSIPVPPIADQDHFATIAFRVRDLEIRCAQSVAQADHLFNSLVQRAFKGEL